MNVDDLIERAWGAVKKAGVPEHIQPAALTAAIEFLRDGNGTNDEPDRQPPIQRPPATSGDGRSSTPKGDKPDKSTPDADAFFTQLAHESGVDETVLRDILQLDGDTVHVVAPTRLLGKTKAEQTRQVIALVAGAHAYGLGQIPVSAEVVHREVKRMRCFDANNFAKSLKSMKGFGPGHKRTEILVRSKWLGEFEEAAKKASSAIHSGEET